MTSLRLMIIVKGRGGPNNDDRRINDKQITVRPNKITSDSGGSQFGDYNEESLRQNPYGSQWDPTLIKPVVRSKAKELVWFYNSR